MDIHPPIKERSNDDLLDITSHPKDWRKEVLIEAKRELLDRGISIRKIDLDKEIKENFQRRIKKAKESASYTSLELIWFFLVSPTQLIGVPFRSVRNLRSEGFKKLWKQRLVITVLGIVFWFYFITFLIE